MKMFGGNDGSSTRCAGPDTFLLNCTDISTLLAIFKLPKKSYNFPSQPFGQLPPGSQYKKGPGPVYCAGTLDVPTLST